MKTAFHFLPNSITLCFHFTFFLALYSTTITTTSITISVSIKRFSVSALHNHSAAGVLCSSGHGGDEECWKCWVRGDDSVCIDLEAA